MQTQSISANSPKKEEKLNTDLSIKSDTESLREAVWFNFPLHKNSSQVGSGSRRGVRSSDTPFKRWGHTSMTYNKSMLIFGGRHSHRSLVNIYSLDLASLVWTKLEPLGQSPPARDSHSALVVKDI
jgi:hypothetical protein